MPIKKYSKKELQEMMGKGSPQKKAIAVTELKRRGTYRKPAAGLRRTIKEAIGTSGNLYNVLTGQSGKKETKAKTMRKKKATAGAKHKSMTAKKRSKGYSLKDLEKGIITGKIKEKYSKKKLELLKQKRRNIYKQKRQQREEDKLKKRLEGL